MILQLLRQLNNLDHCSASFCCDLSLRFPCPLPERISSRILSKSMFIPQNHPKSQQRVRTCAVKEKPVFRASLALSMLETNFTRSPFRMTVGDLGTRLGSCKEHNTATVFCHKNLTGAVVETIATFRSENEDDYYYEFSILSMRTSFVGRHYSKCSRSERKTCTRSRPRPTI